jgi:DNA polymerase-3 subunit epsilon
MSTIAVIDFETTGLSPNMGDRATEVAVVMMEDGRIVDRYQSLINAGVRIPSFIQSLTGITDAMIRKAPPATEVMKALAEFVGNAPLVAHNASFDCKFLDAEWGRIRHRRQQEFACSMLLARRLYPCSPDHKLGTLIRYLSLPTTGTYHRAMADAEMTAHLIVKMESDLKREYQLDAVPHELLCALQRAPKTQIASHVERCRKRFGQ